MRLIFVFLLSVFLIACASPKKLSPQIPIMASSEGAAIVYVYAKHVDTFLIIDGYEVGEVAEGNFVKLFVEPGKRLIYVADPSIKNSRMAQIYSDFKANNEYHLVRSWEGGGTEGGWLGHHMLSGFGMERDAPHRLIEIDSEELSTYQRGYAEGKAKL